MAFLADARDDEQHISHKQPVAYAQRSIIELSCDDIRPDLAAKTIGFLDPVPPFAVAQA